MDTASAGIDFEFGRTKASEAFFQKHPTFEAAFWQLVALMDRSFPGGGLVPKIPAEDVCLHLGVACCNDWFEIVFLAVNGFGVASLKILRGMYERAVTMAYIALYPEKAVRFVRYAEIHRKKALDRALEVMSEDDFDNAMKPVSAQQIREAYESAKDEFQITQCRKCKTKTLAFAWDVDTVTMVRKVDARFGECFLQAYTIPTLHIHATPAAAFGCTEPLNRGQKNAADALLNAMMIMSLVLRTQFDLFGLGLAEELDRCEGSICAALVDADATDAHTPAQG